MMKRVPAMKKGGIVSTVKRMARYVEPHTMQTARYAATTEERKVCHSLGGLVLVREPYIC